MKNHTAKLSRYASFGAKLSGWRVAAGIAHQKELASLLGTTQQSISRWEKGISRPRPHEVEALARVLDVDPQVVSGAAGYAPSSGAVMPVLAYDVPFPLDQLREDSFERFCADFLKAKWPKAQLSLLGARGHTQGGGDIEVTFHKSKVYGFQCKREKAFGRQKVHVAVGKYKRKAARRFILLASIASPGARDAIREHEGWELWDKEDISREVRRLTKVEQRRLVDVYFPNQRRTLIGENEAGPWLSVTEYFAPFLSARGAFSHAWALVGRQAEVKQFAAALLDEQVKVVRIFGAGGSGKSRFLRAAIEGYSKDNRDTRIHIPSSTERVTRKSLEDLGGGKKLLVVDDAHERTDLGPLFEYVAYPQNEARLVLSMRPYGATLVQNEAARFGLIDDAVIDIKLPSLKRAHLIDLAREVLVAHDGDESKAEEIVTFAGDCPLSTVMAAYVVAKDGVFAGLAKNARSFRARLFSSFERVAMGDIGPKGDEEKIRNVLRFVALIQPFSLEDEKLWEAASKIEGIPRHEINRLIRHLRDGGVLFQRGGVQRISPDLLADALIESHCIGATGKSTGYAERVFDLVEGHSLEHLIVNLGRLDWTRNEADPEKSDLLDDIWRKLKPEHEYGDPHIKAVKAVAYYQPARALDFVERLIREGRFQRDLPGILRFVAYSLRHTRSACECLWQMGRDDKRETNPNPDHPIRILHDLCAVKPNKPREFIQKVVDFGLSILEHQRSWIGKFTPLDFLRAVLETEGQVSTWHSRSVSFQKFTINIDFIKPLRELVVDRLIGLLTRDDLPRAALRAARGLAEAVQYPMDGGAREDWDRDFARTFGLVEATVRSGKLSPIVELEVYASIAWHAQYNTGVSAERARNILALAPKTAEFRTVVALQDAWGSLAAKLAGVKERANFAEANRTREAFAKELITLCGGGREVKDFVEALVGAIELHGADAFSAPRVFISALALADVDFAMSVIEDQAGPLARFFDVALSALLTTVPEEALRIVDAAKQSSDVKRHRQIGYAYTGSAATQLVSKETTNNLRFLLSHEDEDVVLSGLAAVRGSKGEPHEIVDLVLDGNIGLSKRTADEACAILIFDAGIRALIDKPRVGRLLGKFAHIEQLQGHWIEEFLAYASELDAMTTCEFFISRIEEAVAQDNWEMRPCNHGPYLHVPLKFRKSSEFSRVLMRFIDWLYQKRDRSVLFDERSAELFAVMIAPVDADFVSVVDELAATANGVQIDALARVLREAPDTLVTRQQEFVLRFLARCSELGKEHYRRACGHLFSVAVSGTRSGTPGVPFDRDVQLKNACEEALSKLTRFDPGYDFYSDLRDYAQRQIEDANREGARLRELDEDDAA